LRTDEKDLNQQIKRLNEDFKRAQDDYAKEANENNQEILQLKKQVNETKTEKELYVQYRARETDGKLSCQRRIFDKEKERLNERIKVLEEQLTTEKLVSERIRKFLQQKADILSKKADDQDRVKDAKVDQITRDREEIYKEKAAEEDTIKEVSQQIQGEEDEKGRRDRDERDRQEELERKRQEKMDMEDAARYIQRKWKWFQEVGKHLAKKKKGKKGKGKKKK
jgi:chromosome segregation ATPase